MTYLTSWDVNTFLCLVYWGIPEDVVKRMMRVVKKAHEDFSLSEAFSYWITNSPALVKSRIRSACPGFTYMFNCPKLEEHDRGCRKEAWYKRRDNILEFKQEWRLRSIEERQKKVIDWCKFGNEQEQQRQQTRFRIFTEYSYMNSKYTKNLWKSWEAGASYYYYVDQNRRNTISKWYEGIHPGRFFLFYKENKIIQERNRGVPSGPCEDGYKYPRTPIYDWGPYEQLIEDLLCIDGEGLGESPGSKIEHIDDLFLD
tara:strand:+ start:989 stop:1756 length:768 start_codon:yes stop_codon:yes gene_type:complete